ncbi:LacI family DNA-binding transcriptional regulator [Actinomadura rubrisoli]|uniref:LacI family transcriptional regulator n=1 Tax=Actinomadura rubrisoli TaxID=2530368 RepID=A0A4R5AKT9_9ACTN|nr:LacI family DNA-binding transcriptional regulator [Actinomadura rubrisoli]TDD73528.1 LacI family transcriptional regulator [Actinomadura rubrisoli]
MVTRRDVARRAGTSEAVVSYVLNDGPRNVAPSTRERVLAAIAELDYRPNAVARSLRNSRTTTIGLVVPDNANPFFAELAREIEDVAFERGHTLLLANARDDEEREVAQVRTLLDRQVDGLILIPCHGPGAWRAELERARIPCLVVDREIEGTDAVQILVDNEGGAAEAVRHLIAHGRTRIGCVAGPDGMHPTLDRVNGWRLALAEAGFDPAAMPVAHAPFGRAEAYRAGRRLLESGPGVDALFVTSDEQAIGVLRAAAELGVAVPDDLAVFSFDGVAPSAYTVPSLSTMRQPFEELGRTVVEMLLAGRDSGGARTEGTAPERVVLATRLVARGSCGCADPAGGDHGIEAAGSPDHG